MALAGVRWRDGKEGKKKASQRVDKGHMCRHDLTETNQRKSGQPFRF